MSPGFDTDMEERSGNIDHTATSIWGRGWNVITDWYVPVMLGLSTAVGVWIVWYFTKVPCTIALAELGVCNPSAVANLINVDILVKSGGGGLTVGAIKGGYVE